MFFYSERFSVLCHRKISAHLKKRIHHTEKRSFIDMLIFKVNLISNPGSVLDKNGGSALSIFMTRHVYAD